MEHRLPIPGRQSLLRRLLNAQIIGIAAVVMYVVDERHASRFADRQQETAGGPRDRVPEP